MRGREIILFKDVTTIGADSRCDVVLANDPSVAAQHVAFRRTGGSVAIEPVTAVTVNDETVTTPRYLSHGDVVTVGSTTINYEERAAS